MGLWNLMGMGLHQDGFQNSYSSYEIAESYESQKEAKNGTKKTA